MRVSAFLFGLQCAVSSHLEHPLPAYKVLTDLSPYVSSFRFIYDTGIERQPEDGSLSCRGCEHGLPPDSMEFLRQRYGESNVQLDKPVYAEKFKVLEYLSERSREAVRDKGISQYNTNWDDVVVFDPPENESDDDGQLGVDWLDSDCPDGASRCVYGDTTLLVPLGHRLMMTMRSSMESLVAQRVWPKELILIIGIDPKITDDVTNWVLTLMYLQKLVRPFLPPQVRIRVGVYDGPGGPTVSRILGVRHSTQKFSVYTDADDLMGLSAISWRVNLMRKFPEITQALTGYSDWLPAATIKELDKLRTQLPEPIATALNTERGPLLNLSDFKEVDSLPPLQEFLRTLYSGVAEAFLRTRYDFKEDLANYQINEAVSRVDVGFKNKNKHIDENTIEGWPQLSFFHDCDGWLDKIKNAEKQPGALTSPEEAEAEKRALDYFAQNCGKHAHPEYVLSCANGWGAFRNEDVVGIPATTLTYGEDSLMNFIISHSGYVSVCSSGSGGVYVKGHDRYARVYLAC